jgi:hypothetical protein
VKIHRRLRQMFFVATLAVCAIAVGQEQHQNTLVLSPVLRTSFYPEVMCAHCIVPTWDQHYLLHLEIDKDPSLITMFDREGKKVVEGRVSLQDASRISVRAAGATQDGQVLVVGGATMADGSIQHFIAQVGATGRTLRSIQVGEFSPQQVCAAGDGTVWALGYDWGSKGSTEADDNVLRHYGFAHGLLGRYVSLGSVSDAKDAVILVESPHQSFLRCQQGGISILFWSVSNSVVQYVVLNPESGEVARWKVIAPFAGAKANGFAVTDDGRAFVSLVGWNDSDNTLRHGLYKLPTTTRNPAVTLIPVGGTVTALKCRDCGNALPDGTFLELYGADGDELVVRRTGDGWGLSWSRVSTSASAPD